VASGSRESPDVCFCCGKAGFQLDVSGSIMLAIQPRLPPYLYDVRLPLLCRTGSVSLSSATMLEG
jgi:hypothetical protein